MCVTLPSDVCVSVMECVRVCVWGGNGSWLCGVAVFREDLRVCVCCCVCETTIRIPNLEVVSTPVQLCVLYVLPRGRHPV